MLTKEMQDHTGEAGATDPNVQYAYSTTSGTYNGIADVLTKGHRPTETVYPNGRKSFLSYGSGDTNDAISRLAAVKDDDGSGGEGSTLSAYSFNGLGRLAVEDFEQPDVRLDYFRQPDGTQTSGTYKGFDRFGRVATQAWRAYTASALREELAYGYDENSNRTYRENVLAGGSSKKLDELYGYDDLDRLIDFKRGGLNVGKDAIAAGSQNRLRGEHWTLSETGNWTDYQVDADGDSGCADDDYNDAGDLDQDRIHNAVNEIYHATPDAAITEVQGQVSWEDPGHDSRGNMTTVPKPGDMTETYTCAYDAWNRLVKVTDDEDDDAVVAEYRYDGLNRRIRKFTPDGEDWTVTEYYYNASWQVLEVREEDGVERSGEPAVSVTVHEQYVWSARYIDAPILRDRDSDGDDQTGNLGKTGSGLDERLYYLTDAHMNVTAVVTPAGAVVERYHYDPYGRVTVLDGTTSGQTDWATDDQVSDVANEILWCGYRRDPETGLYHIRHRMYHALLGRWLQRDPLGYVDGMGLYEYCRSGAVVLIDPLGQGAEGLPPFVDEILGTVPEGSVEDRIATGSIDIAQDPMEDIASSLSEEKGDFKGRLETLWDAKDTEAYLRVSHDFIGDGEASMRAEAERIHRGLLLAWLVYLEKECDYEVDWEALREAGADITYVKTELPDAGDAVLLVVGGRIVCLGASRAWQFAKPLVSRAGQYAYIQGMNFAWWAGSLLGGGGQKTFEEISVRPTLGSDGGTSMIVKTVCTKTGETLKVVHRVVDAAGNVIHEHVKFIK